MCKVGRRDVLVEHVGSAHTDAELGVLLERARRVATGDDIHQPAATTRAQDPLAVDQEPGVIKAHHDDGSVSDPRGRLGRVARRLAIATKT
jgi:hypothetical protein